MADVGVLDVTVVIPMFNAAPYIGRAVDSVLAQTVPPARIVVVDDCSTDDSVEVVRGAYAHNDSVELMLSEKNGGIAVTRNRGARGATTEWLAFLDADDWWQPAFLERTLGALDEFGADFGSAGGMRERPKGEGKHVQVRLLPGRPETIDLTEEFWRVSRRFRPMVPYGAVMRRSLFEEIGGFWERMRTGEDSCMWAHLWLRGRFAFVNLPLVESAVVGSSVSAHKLPYHAVALNLRCMYNGVFRAIAMRRPGTRWFIVFALGRTVTLHTRYLLGLRRPMHPGARKAAE